MLYLARHGSTALNAGDPADPRDYFRGWVDAPLTGFGIQQGAQTARWFADKGIRRIVTSDLKRAQQSAALIGRTTGVKPEPDYRWRPWDIGALSGQLITPEKMAMMNDAQENMNQALPQGESYNHFLARYAPALLEAMQAGDAQDLVVVTSHRNLLAIPHMLTGKKPATKGPPAPSGVIVIGPKGTVHEVFVPPLEQKLSKENAAS